MNKRALLISFDPDQDIPIAKFLNKMGYSIFGMLEEHPFVNAKAIAQFLKDSKKKHGLENEIKTLPAQYVLDKDILRWTKYQIREILKIIKQKNISFLFPSCQIYGHLHLILGLLNQSLDLPGIDYNQARFWYRKSRYLKYFKDRGFKVPKIFQRVLFLNEIDFSSIPFPCVCKPDCGVGGFGVFLAEGPEDLKQLFWPAEKNKQSSSVTGRFYRKKFPKQRVSNYLYNEMYSRYLITEFVPGPVVSVAGIKAKNGIEVSLIFEIESEPPPFRTENSYTAPFNFTDEEALESLCSSVKKAVQEPVFPNGPFMFDFILNPKGELYLLEADPRISEPSHRLLEYCYNDPFYIERAVLALLNEEIKIKERRKPEKYIYSKDLPLPEGVFTSFSQREPFSPDVLDFNFDLKPGDKIFLPQVDWLSQQRGCLTTAGKTPDLAKLSWFDNFAKLDFSIKKQKQIFF